MKSLIGLVGRKGSGKDTAAVALMNEGYHMAKFAGALKEMVRSYLYYLGVHDDAATAMIENAQVKEIASDYFRGKTPRFVMQTLGTEWGRDTIGQDIWVNACMQHCSQFEKAVITDVRFPNEVQAVVSQGGIIIRIVRNGSKTDQHSSETLIDSLAVDHEICNNGTIEELHEALLNIVKGQNVRN